MRQRGYAVSRGQVTVDATSVAAPITDQRETVVAAVSLVVHSDDADPARLAPIVRAAALGISRNLGHRPAGRPPDHSGSA